MKPTEQVAGKSENSEVEVYYHTRKAAELHTELYFQATVFPSQESVSNLAQLGLYEKAAVIKILAGVKPEDALEIAYKSTQNIHDSWTKNEGVTAITETPRSSMLGDVFVLKGQAYTVASFGFTALERFDPTPEVKKTVARKYDSEGPSF